MDINTSADTEIVIKQDQSNQSDSLGTIVTKTKQKSKEVERTKLETSSSCFIPFEHIQWPSCLLFDKNVTTTADTEIAMKQEQSNHSDSIVTAITTTQQKSKEVERSVLDCLYWTCKQLAPKEPKRIQLSLSNKYASFQRKWIHTIRVTDVESDVRTLTSIIPSNLHGIHKDTLQNYFTTSNNSIYKSSPNLYGSESATSQTRHDNLKPCAIDVSSSTNMYYFWQLLYVWLTIHRGHGTNPPNCESNNFAISLNKILIPKHDNILTIVSGRQTIQVQYSILIFALQLIRTISEYSKNISPSIRTVGTWQDNDYLTKRQLCNDLSGNNPNLRRLDFVRDDTTTSSTDCSESGTSKFDKKRTHDSKDTFQKPYGLPCGDGYIGQTSILKRTNSWKPLESYENCLAPSKRKVHRTLEEKFAKKARKAKRQLKREERKLKKASTATNPLETKTLADNTMKKDENAWINALPTCATPALTAIEGQDGSDSVASFSQNIRDDGSDSVKSFSRNICDDGSDSVAPFSQNICDDVEKASSDSDSLSESLHGEVEKLRIILQKANKLRRDRDSFAITSQVYKKRKVRADGGYESTKKLHDENQKAKVGSQNPEPIDKPVDVAILERKLNSKTEYRLGKPPKQAVDKILATTVHERGHMAPATNVRNTWEVDYTSSPHDSYKCIGSTNSKMTREGVAGKPTAQMHNKLSENSTRNHESTKRVVYNAPEEMVFDQNNNVIEDSHGAVIETNFSENQIHIPLLQHLCSESFIDNWGNVVVELATGTWAVESQWHAQLPRIHFIDTYLVDTCTVDIELPGRCGILLCKTSTMDSINDSKNFVLHVAKLVSIGRYKTLYIYLCYDTEVTPCIAMNVTQLQCAVNAACGIPLTKIFFKPVSLQTVSVSLATTISIHSKIMTNEDNMQHSAILMNTTNDFYHNRASFLLSLLPTLSARGAIECLLLANEMQPAGPSFKLLFLNERLRQRILLRSTSSCNCDVHPLAMIQLSMVLNVLLSGSVQAQRRSYPFI